MIGKNIPGTWRSNNYCTNDCSCMREICSLGTLGLWLTQYCFPVLGDIPGVTTWKWMASTWPTPGKESFRFGTQVKMVMLEQHQCRLFCQMVMAFTIWWAMFGNGLQTGGAFDTQKTSRKTRWLFGIHCILWMYSHFQGLFTWMTISHIQILVI